MSAYQVAQKDGFKGNEQEWLASLKGATGPKGEKGDQGPQGAIGPQGPAGEGGGGSKLKRVFYDGMVRKKAVFENDDGTSIESDIFSDPNLPANPKNLSLVSLLKSDQPQALKPQVLSAGLSDTTIKVPFKVHTKSPSSDTAIYNSLDIHLDTSNLLDRKESEHFKFINSVEEFAKHQWLAKEASVSRDGKTVAVRILPVVNTNWVYIPLFDQKWYNSIGDFEAQNGYNFVPNLTGADSDFDYSVNIGADNFIIFRNFEKISFATLGDADSMAFLMLLYGAGKPLVNAGPSNLANLSYGSTRPLNIIFKGANN